MASNKRLRVDSSTGIQKLAQSTNKFCFELYKKLSAQSGNLSHSPMSLSIALGMLYHGARGISKAQMRGVLNYDSENISDEEIQEGFKKFLDSVSESSDYILGIANLVLIENSFTINPDYTAVLKTHYQAEARNVDFLNELEKFKDEINVWAALKTCNKIENLIGKIEPDTLLILVSAVYFKASWEKPFDAKLTEPDSFYNNGLTSLLKRVQMMKFTAEKFRYCEMRGEDFHSLELPYIGSISMWILLPNKLDGLSQLEEGLNIDVILRMIAESSSIKLNEIKIPKFKIEFNVDLVDHFNELGMQSLFNKSADLKGISNEGKLLVSHVFHKTCIEVNEEGTEASVATGLISRPMWDIVEPPNLLLTTLSCM